MDKMIFSLLGNIRIKPPSFQVKPDDLTAGLNRVFFWAGVVAVIMIVIAGIQYITSSGDPNKAVTAKYAVYYSSIGLVIVLLAFAIVNIVLKAF